MPLIEYLTLELVYDRARTQITVHSLLLTPRGHAAAGRLTGISLSDGARRSLITTSDVRCIALRSRAREQRDAREYASGTSGVSMFCSSSTGTSVGCWVRCAVPPPEQEKRYRVQPANAQVADCNRVGTTCSRAWLTYQGCSDRCRHFVHDLCCKQCSHHVLYRCVTRTPIVHREEKNRHDKDCEID
jgi:hypothetical protein